MRQILILLLGCVCGSVQCEAQMLPGHTYILNFNTHTGKASPIVAQPFDLQNVRLLDGPFQKAQEIDRKYLLSLDADRLLHTFRLTAGLPSTVEPYDGWEKPDGELRGHTMGHYLSACSLMYASTGDEKFKQRVDYLVTELAKCQANISSQGYHAGYLSAFPESFFDRVDARQKVWAPWYTMHKIMAGLFDAYQLTGNQQALDVLNKLADWVKFRVDRLSEVQMQASLQTEQGGMNEVLANLYAVTKNPDHLRLAEAFNHHAVLDPLSQKQDKLDGLHANTQIPKLIGAAREYELTGRADYHDAAEFFWEDVVNQRSYVIGGDSYSEHFFPVTEFAKHLGPVTAETCNTYNMLKLTRHIFEWQPTVAAMDFYERGLFNDILASQNPRDGTFTYFMPLKTGHFKVYSTTDSTFWCCVGTGMENHAKYADTIYFHDDQTLWVNLFIASELSWKEKGITLRQETNFPESDSTKLIFKMDQPTKLALKLRFPSWLENGASVFMNGKSIGDLKVQPGSYGTVEREWRDGDVVEMKLPMGLRTEPLPGDASQVAVLYGPILLAGKMGTSGIEKMSLESPDAEFYTLVATPPMPVMVSDDAAAIVSRIKPDPNSSLTFSTGDLTQPGPVTLVPFYQVHFERYIVYWKIDSQQQWKDESKKRADDAAVAAALAARIVDRVSPGDDESEKEHHFAGENTETGNRKTRAWRNAQPGGSMSYRFKSISDSPLVLRCTFIGEQSNDRDFVILVDGQQIAEQKLQKTRNKVFGDYEYPIPENLTRGKDSLTISFKPIGQSVAGGLFDCTLLKADLSATTQAIQQGQN